MFTRLRRNFILVAMCSILAVLAIIVGTLNVISYRNMVNRAEVMEEILKENADRFVEGGPRPEEPFREDNKGKQPPLPNDHFEREQRAFQTLLITSISVSVVGLFAVFVLVVIFTKKVFRPVAESYEKQKRFITDASHELKTPLTIISANVEVLELEEGENAWTESIQKQIGRMNKLVEQMVTLNRMDEDNTLQEVTRFDLSEAVSETAELYVPVAARQEKTMTLQIEEEVKLCGDEAAIRQLVSLLLDNALKYSDKSGQIKVTLKKRGKHSELSIWNSVEEIQKGNLDRLFERFYRLDSSRNSGTGGSGIGLSIAKSIVEAHKGKISARSTDGRSIEFIVNFL